MDYTRLTDSELAEFAGNAATKLAEHSVTCFDAATADELAAKIGTKGDALAADLEEIVRLRTMIQSINARKAERRAEIRHELSLLKYALRAWRGSASDHKLLGLTYRKKWTNVTANDPTGLVVNGQSNGVNVIRFKGNNKPHRVVYHLWRRDSKAGKWQLIGQTTKQTYEDNPVTPGQHYEYKVMAVGSKTKSGWSNAGVVYEEGK